MYYRGARFALTADLGDEGSNQVSGTVLALFKKSCG